MIYTCDSKISSVLSLVTLNLLAAIPAMAQPTDKSRPNILYIFTDDQSIRTVGSYPQAHPWVHTPHIDSLAEEGVRFAYAYTGAKCVPSRGNALTGQLQVNYTRETPYWPAEFRKQGYYTGMIGKWHWSTPRHDETWDWSAVWEHHLPENHKNYYWDQSLRINGDSLVKLDRYSTDGYTDYAVQFIREQAAGEGKPWYLWLCYDGVHGPYTPAERHKKRYLNEPETEIPADVFGPRPDKPEHMVHFSMWNKDKKTGLPVFRKRSLDSWVKQYNQAVASLDEGVGRIMQTLRETGQSENTVVIFTSDQGFAWGQHGYRLKMAPYDAALLAPLIIVQPGITARGRVCNYPVNGTDIIATIHELAGVPPAGKADGRDLSALLSDPGMQNWDSSPMIQAYTGHLYGDQAITEALDEAFESGDWTKFITHERSGIPAWIMLREGKYKYIRYLLEDYQEEFYDLERDPEELHNLAVEKAFRPRLAELREKTLQAFRNQGALFVDKLPAPKVAGKHPVD